MRPNRSPSASDTDDLLCRSPNPLRGAVDAKIVVLRRTPVPAGIGVAVFFPPLIDFPDGILRLFWADALDLHPASDLTLQGRADEQTDCRDAGGAGGNIGAPAQMMQDSFRASSRIP